jgi:rhamnogalacturonyl hydrolase YesR
MVFWDRGTSGYYYTIAELVDTLPQNKPSCTLKLMG